MADWQFIDNAMTYLSYATGYKSGGYDGQVFSAYVTGPFEPEEMTSIEWGVKGDFFEDTVRVEGFTVQPGFGRPANFHRHQTVHDRFDTGRMQ